MSPTWKLGNKYCKHVRETGHKSSVTYGNKSSGAIPSLPTLEILVYVDMFYYFRP